VEDAVGEHVSALAIGRELDLVHREEVHPPGQGHGLHGADEVLGALGNDPLLAGDEGHGIGAPARDHPVVVLAGEEAQGKPDHPRAVLEHPLQGEVGLAGVGGAQEGGDRGPHENRIDPRAAVCKPYGEAGSASSR
jgi:hypothetical protein